MVTGTSIDDATARVDTSTKHSSVVSPSIKLISLSSTALALANTPRDATDYFYVLSERRQCRDMRFAV